MDGTLDTR